MELGLGSIVLRGIGGDPVNGLKHIDVMKMFNDDPETDAVIMVGEIGGDAEENLRTLDQRQHEKTGGRLHRRRHRPARQTYGHAGAIISGGKGTAQEKLAVMGGVASGDQEPGRHGDDC